jgi:hypothetical protein
MGIQLAIGQYHGQSIAQPIAKTHRQRRLSLLADPGKDDASKTFGTQCTQSPLDDAATAHKSRLGTDRARTSRSVGQRVRITRLADWTQPAPRRRQTPWNLASDKQLRKMPMWSPGAAELAPRLGNCRSQVQTATKMVIQPSGECGRVVVAAR